MDQTNAPAHPRTPSARPTALPGLAFSVLLLVGGTEALAQGKAVADKVPAQKPYEVEWVYRVAYGHQAEWWAIFQKYQVAILDREKQLGYVTDYAIYRPSLHASEADRWDYRIVITYPNQAGATHESEVEAQLFPDHAAFEKDDQRRWELTTNHWDLPIHKIDPHGR